MTVTRIDSTGDQAFFYIKFTNNNKSITLYDSATGSDAGNTYDKNIIIGIWENRDPSDGCVRSYTFGANGTFFSFSSLAYSAIGTYSFNKKANTSGRHALMLSFTDDAGGPDCGGNSSSLAGASLSGYLRFTNNNKTFVFSELSTDDAEESEPFHKK